MASIPGTDFSSPRANVPGMSALSICTGPRSFFGRLGPDLVPCSAEQLHHYMVTCLSLMRLPGIIMIHFPSLQSFGFESHSYCTDDKVRQDKLVRAMIPSQYWQDACPRARASPQITPVGATLYYDLPARVTTSCAKYHPPSPEVA